MVIDTGVLGDYNITITKTGGANDIYLESSTDNSSGSYSLIQNNITEVILTNTGTPSHTYDRWVQIQGSGGGNVTVTITGTNWLVYKVMVQMEFHLNFSNSSDVGEDQAGSNDFTASGLTGLVQAESYNSTHGSDITEAEVAKIFDGDDATYGEASGDFIGFDYIGTAVTMKVENTSASARIFYIQPRNTSNPPAFANAGTWSNLSAGSSNANNWSVPANTTATGTFTFPTAYNGDGRIYLNSYNENYVFIL